MNDVPIVYIVDDDFGMLKALERLLHADGLTVHAFSSPEDFLAAHDPSTRGCVVLDVSMPGLNGLAVQQSLLASRCERYIVFITGHGAINDCVQAMKAGAVDFLIKPFQDTDFLTAVRNAIKKDESARTARQLVQSVRNRASALTPREYQVLEQVIAGRRNKQIAFDLGAAEKTIKVHRARAMEKMGAKSLAELVRITAEAGIEAAYGRSYDVRTLPSYRPNLRGAFSELDKADTEKHV